MDSFYHKAAHDFPNSPASSSRTFEYGNIMTSHFPLEMTTVNPVTEWHRSREGDGGERVRESGRTLMKRASGLYSDGTYNLIKVSLLASIGARNE